MKIKLKKKDWERIRHHLRMDLSFGGGGTFVKECSCENEPNIKEIEKVEKIINQVDMEFIK